MKASRSKDSKGVVVLTTPSFGELPKNFFQIFQTSNHYLVKKVWWCPKKPVSLSQQNLKRYDEYECASMDSGDRSGLVGGPQRPLLAARRMDHQTRCCNHSSPFDREVGIESRNYG